MPRETWSAPPRVLEKVSGKAPEHEEPNEGWVSVRGRQRNGYAEGEDEVERKCGARGMRGNDVDDGGSGHRETRA